MATTKVNIKNEVVAPQTLSEKLAFARKNAVELSRILSRTRQFLTFKDITSFAIALYDSSFVGVDPQEIRVECISKEWDGSDVLLVSGSIKFQKRPSFQLPMVIREVAKYIDVVINNLPEDDGFSYNLPTKFYPTIRSIIDSKFNICYHDCTSYKEPIILEHFEKTFNIIYQKLIRSGDVETNPGPLSDYPDEIFVEPKSSVPAQVPPSWAFKHHPIKMFKEDHMFEPSLIYKLHQQVSRLPRIGNGIKFDAKTTLPLGPIMLKSNPGDKIKALTKNGRTIKPIILRSTPFYEALNMLTATNTGVWSVPTMNSQCYNIKASFSHEYVRKDGKSIVIQVHICDRATSRVSVNYVSIGDFSYMIPPYLSYIVTQCFDEVMFKSKLSNQYEYFIDTLMATFFNITLVSNALDLLDTKSVEIFAYTETPHLSLLDLGQHYPYRVDMLKAIMGAPVPYKKFWDYWDTRGDHIDWINWKVSLASMTFHEAGFGSLLSYGIFVHKDNLTFLREYFEPDFVPEHDALPMPPVNFEHLGDSVLQFFFGTPTCFTSMTTSTRMYSYTHIFKACYRYGLCREQGKSALDGLRVEVCATCYASIHQNEVRECCFGKKKPQLTALVKKMQQIEASYTYWMQKILGSRKKTWNALLHWNSVCDSQHNRLKHEIRSHIFMEVERNTMENPKAPRALRMLGLGEQYDDMRSITAEVGNQLNITREILQQATEQDVIGRVSNLMTRVESVLPILEGSTSITDYLQIFDTFLRDKVFKITQTIFPFFTESDMPNIKFTMMLRDYVLMKHVNNKVIKSALMMDMIKQAGLFEFLSTFISGILTFDSGVEKTTSMSEVSDWIQELIGSPSTWYGHISKFIVGFVSLFKLPFQKSHLLDYIKKVGSSFRDMSSINNGVLAIGSLFTMLARCYYLAKEYVMTFLGFKCDVPMFVHIREHITNWTAAVDTLVMPVHRNTIINTEASYPLVDKIAEVGIKLLAQAPPGPLNTLCVNAHKELLKLRACISWKRGLNPSVAAPFVFHLDGKPGIGKSALVTYFANALADVLKINPKIYIYNESLKFFDGYNQEEIIVCDDVNLLKTPETLVWLIKLVSTNLCLLPVAENENRPMRSNCKVVILTSNTPYSVTEGVATVEGIDRRSAYKFKVTSKHYNDKSGLVEPPPEGIDWSTEHTFTRIASIKGKDLPEGSQFVGDRDDTFRFLAKEALEHKAREVIRVQEANPTWVPHHMSEELRVCLMDGITPGNERVDLEAIRESIEKIKFSTADSFVERATLGAEDMALIDKVALRFDRMDNKVFIRSIEDQLHTYKTQNSYPVFLEDKIVFTGKKPDDLPTGYIDTQPLGRPFRVGAHSLDYYFLHHLESTDEGWIITKYYNRLDFKPDDPLRVPGTRRFDYNAMESLICDSSFMDSWKLFFSFTQVKQLRIYADFMVYMNTVKMLGARREQRWKQVTKFISCIFSRNTLFGATLGSMIAFFSMATACVFVDTMTKMLIYEAVSNSVEESTSNAPRPPQQKTGVRSTLTMSTPTSNGRDTGFADTKAKVIKNLYLAHFKSDKGNNLGCFNILFLTERFALIPYHVMSKVPTQTCQGGVYTIYIWSDQHSAHLRYTFNIKNSYRVPLKDAFVIHIPAFRAQRSIMNAWNRTVLDEAEYGLSLETIYQDTFGINATRTTLYCVDPKVTSSLPYGLPHTYHQMYNTPISMPGGSSGGISIIDSTKIQTKLIGIQSSSTDHHSHIQALTQFDLQNAIEYIQTTLTLQYEIPTCDIPYEETTSSEYPTQIGTVDKCNAISVSPKTQIKKTPWYGKIIIPPNRFPVLQHTAREDIINFVNKNEKTALKPFNQDILNETVVEYSEYLKGAMNAVYGFMRPISIVNMKDAVNGNYIGGKPFDLNASPGIGSGNWVKNRTKKGQNDFIVFNGSEYELSPEMTDATNKLFASCMSGQTKKSTYASFPKDELRPLLKDARGIDGAPLEQKILYRMLFGRLDGLLVHANRGQLKYGLGINLFSPSGTNLISRMKDQVMAWDFSKYDGSITYQMYEAVVRVYNRLSYYDEYSTARHALAYLTCHATIVVDDKLFQPNKGMRSGFGGTSSFNTHIHNLFLILAIKELLRSKENSRPDIHDVFAAVDWITYGDDGLAWLKEPDLSNIINGETIAQKFHEFGLIVTDPRGKNDLPPQFIPISEATFLKQSPYYDDTFHLPLWRVQEDCLQSVFNYYSGDDPYEPLDSAFHMLWPHGQDRFEKYRRKLNAMLEKHGKVYSKSWHAYLEEFNIDFEGIPYTGDIESFHNICRTSECNPDVLTSTSE